MPGRADLKLVVLAFLLLALTGAVTWSGNARSRCQRHLNTIAEALERWSQDHDGHYPSSLYQLVPAYLPALPSCPADASGDYSPFYRTTSDRAWFGLACPANHLPWLPRLNSSLGCSNRKPGAEGEFGRAEHSLGQCRTDLAAAAVLVEVYRKRYQMPRKLSECVLTPTPAAETMAVVSPNGRDFQIVCLELHLEEGIAPLSPRWDSRRGIIVEPLEIPSPPLPIRASKIQLTSLAGLLGIWAFYRWSRRPRPARKPSPRPRLEGPGPATTLARLLRWKVARLRSRAR